MGGPQIDPPRTLTQLNSGLAPDGSRYVSANVACGYPVIDLSTPMLRQLQVKLGSDAIDVTTGDFATTRVADTFQLVYLIYNTIENVTTQRRTSHLLSERRAPRGRRLLCH
jgi:hypothetical protein